MSGQSPSHHPRASLVNIVATEPLFVTRGRGIMLGVCAATNAAAPNIGPNGDSGAEFQDHEGFIGRRYNPRHLI
jgi:hypothetical protein